MKKYKHSEIRHLQAEHLPPLEWLESALDLDPVLVLGPLMAQLPVLLLPVQLELVLQLVELTTGAGTGGSTAATTSAPAGIIGT